MYVAVSFHIFAGREGKSFQIQTWNTPRAKFSVKYRSSDEKLGPRSGPGPKAPPFEIAHFASCILLVRKMRFWAKNRDLRTKTHMDACVGRAACVFHSFELD